MQNSNLVSVGKIREAHGLKGEVYVILFAKRGDWAEDLKEFILVRKERVNDKTVEVTHNFKVKRIKKHKIGLIIKTEELLDRTAAEAFEGSIFQIPAEKLISGEGERIYLKEIEGFDVLNGDELLGQIQGFASNGPQDILMVPTVHGEALIPLIPQFIEKLDFKNKSIRMKLPEGLVPTAQPT